MTSPKLKSTLDHYLTHYAGSSPHTQKAKSKDLEHFLRFLREFKRVKSVANLTLKDWDFTATYQFVEYLLSHGESPATVSRRLATLKHAGRSLSEHVASFKNPTKEVKPPKVKALKPKAIMADELEEIKEKASDRLLEKPNFNRLRNKVLFELLLDTGIRADEVRNLKVLQLDRDLEWIKNVRTKSKQYRNVYITSIFRPTLSSYLEERAKEIKKRYPNLPKKVADSIPIFPSFYNANPEDPDSFLMGAKSVWRAIHELSKDTKLHPHLLRHSFATDLLDSSKDIRLVAQALGHSDVRITMRYTERTAEEVAEALEKSRRSTTHS